jgi:hypothetical protein
LEILGVSKEQDLLKKIEISILKGNLQKGSLVKKNFSFQLIKKE